jgi:nucleotide-binding universal stress UspA family protein
MTFNAESRPAGTSAIDDGAPPFGSIVCGVDGSRSSLEAVRQTLALAGPATTIVFACVRSSKGTGPTHQSTIGRSRALEALDEAVALAAESGVDAAAEMLHGDDPARLLIEEGSRSDLLVVASHGDSRVSGILLGSTAAVAVHRAPVPVLVARRPPGETDFPKRIVAAGDGSDDGHAAIEYAARIGRRHQSHLVLVAVDPEHPEHLPEDAIHLSEDYGIEATAIRRRGRPADQIVSVARAEDASLVVVGSRGLTGVRALGSVSERVCHRAPCSVLIARPPGRLD